MLRRPALIFVPALALPAFLLEAAIPLCWRILLGILLISLVLCTWRLKYFKLLFILFFCLNLTRCYLIHEQASKLRDRSLKLNFTLEERLWQSPHFKKSGWQARLDSGVKFTLILPSKYDKAKRLSTACLFKDPEAASNPGGFNEAEYLRSKGIFLCAECQGDIKVLAWQSPLSLSWEKFRTSIADDLSKTYGESASAYMRALFLGDKTVLSKEQKYNFSALSLQHLTAVSGMHLAFILLPLRALKIQEKFGRTIALITQYSVIVLFYCLASAPAGLFRAIIVLGFRDISRMFSLRDDSLNSLALAFIILALINPYAIFEQGIIWSFGAAATIFLLRLPISERLSRKFPTCSKETCNKLAVMLAAQFAVLLLGGRDKARFSILNLILQMPLLAIFQTVFISSFISIILALIPLLNKLVLVSGLAKFTQSIFKGLDLLLSSLVKLPEWQIFHPYLNGLSLAAMLLLFLALLTAEHSLLRYLYRRFRLPIKFIFYLLLLFSQILPFLCHKTYFTFVDVGQGDGMVLSIGQKHLLVDGGVSAQAGKTWLPYMDKEGILYFDAALITHADADHMAAAAELLSMGKIRRLFIPERFTAMECKQVAEEGQYSLESTDPAESLLALCQIWTIPVNRISPGNHIQLAEDTFLRCLEASSPPVYPYEDSNESSLITLLEMEGIRILLTADMTERQEAILVHEEFPPCQIHKVAHHGSGKTSFPQLLNKVKADLSLISVGKKNVYGHPHPDLMKRLADTNTLILRTDEDGAVRLRSLSPRTWEAKSFKSKTCLNGVK